MCVCELCHTNDVIDVNIYKENTIKIRILSKESFFFLDILCGDFQFKID